MNSRKLKALLTSVVPNNLQSGPLKVILDVGDPEYYRRRALEFIHSGQIKDGIFLLAVFLEQTENPSSSRPGGKDCHRPDGVPGKASVVGEADAR